MNAGIAAFRAGNAPHIMQVFEVGTATMMAATGAVKPVYKLMAETGEKFDPKAYLSAITGYYSTSKGEMLSFPFNSSSTVMWVNLDALKKANIAEIPKTWPEVFEAAKKLKAAGYDTCGFSNAWVDLGQSRAALGLAQRAARPPRPTASTASTPCWSSTARCRSSICETLIELQKDKTYDYSGRTNTGEGRFTSGECPIFLTSSAFFGNVKAQAKFNWTNAPMPYYPDVKGAPQNSIIGGASLWVMGGKTAEEYKGVAKFLTFLSDTDRQVWHPQDLGLSADHQGGLREGEGRGLLQGPALSRDAAARADQQGADREFARACGSATWCSCATSGRRRSSRRWPARRPPRRRSTRRSSAATRCCGSLKKPPYTDMMR